LDGPVIPVRPRFPVANSGLGNPVKREGETWNHQGGLGIPWYHLETEGSHWDSPFGFGTFQNPGGRFPRVLGGYSPGNKKTGLGPRRGGGLGTFPGFPFPTVGWFGTWLVV